MFLCLSVCLCVPDSPSLSPTNYLGLLDRTRMFLCLFMMTLFVFNPFAGIVQLGRGFPTSWDNSNAGRSAGRTLLASDSTEPGTCVFCQFANIAGNFSKNFYKFISTFFLSRQFRIFNVAEELLMSLP